MVAAQPTAPLVAYWSASRGDVGAWATGRLMLQLVDPYPVLQAHAGPEDSLGTGADAYNLWYRIAPLAGNVPGSRPPSRPPTRLPRTEPPQSSSLTSFLPLRIQPSSRHLPRPILDSSREQG